MSIEKRDSPFSRSFRSLIKACSASKAIKDLKDLSVLRERANYRHSGPTDLRDVFPSASDGEGQALALR